MSNAFERMVTSITRVVFSKHEASEASAIKEHMEEAEKAFNEAVQEAAEKMLEEHCESSWHRSGPEYY